jgi:hypothetical protein
VFAAVAALVGASLARTERRAEAVNGSLVYLGDAAFGTSTTSLAATAGFSGTDAFKVFNPLPDPGVGIVGQGGIVKSGGYGLRSESGDLTGSGPGGFGVAPSGGNASSGKAGAALHAVGGSGSPASNFTGGHGAVLFGADSDTNVGGSGARASGGASIHPPGGQSGVGVYATGGKVGKGDAPAGLTAHGGDGKESGSTPGVGLIAYGGQPRQGGSQDGIGAVGVGGGASNQQVGILGIGSATNAGVAGTNAGGGPAMYAESVSKAGSNGVATVYGKSVKDAGGAFDSTNGAGVVGAASNFGLQAESTSGAGLTGVSQSGYGVRSTGVADVGCHASSGSGGGAQFQTQSPVQAALYAYNSQATPATAGTVTGLYAHGDITVATNGAKMAAVPTSRGLTLLYCLEAPVPLLEDFGSVRLSRGRARVDLDPRFAATIETTSYRVFLTPQGETAGVYMAARDGRGFEIVERQGGTSSADIAYRITAWRKGVTAADRLAPFTPPPPVRPPDPVWPLADRGTLPALPQVPPRPDAPPRPPEPGDTDFGTGRA